MSPPTPFLLIHIHSVGNPFGFIFKICPDSNNSPLVLLPTPVPGISYLEVDQQFPDMPRYGNSWSLSDYSANLLQGATEVTGRSHSTSSKNPPANCWTTVGKCQRTCGVSLASLHQLCFFLVLNWRGPGLLRGSTLGTACVGMRSPRDFLVYIL